jgi:hypothetical protein
MLSLVSTLIHKCVLLSTWTIPYYNAYIIMMLYECMITIHFVIRVVSRERHLFIFFLLNVFLRILLELSILSCFIFQSENICSQEVLRDNMGCPPSFVQQLVFPKNLSNTVPIPQAHLRCNLAVPHDLILEQTCFCFKSQNRGKVTYVSQKVMQLPLYC